MSQIREGRLGPREMQRVAMKTRSFAEADQWDREQSWALTPDERLRILKVLQERVYGKNSPDVREGERRSEVRSPLAPEDRADLMDAVLASLPMEVALEEAWSEEMQRRIEEFETGRVQGIPAETVFADARARLRGRG